MSEPKQRVTAERACMEMNRIEELLATTKLNDMMHKKDDDQKTTVLWILAIIGAVFGNGYVKNKVMEFVGPGVSTMTTDYRNGIDVMTTETTCLSSVWRTDEDTRAFMEEEKIITN